MASVESGAKARAVQTLREELNRNGTKPCGRAEVVASEMESPGVACYGLRMCVAGRGCVWLVYAFEDFEHAADVAGEIANDDHLAVAHGDDAVW